MEVVDIGCPRSIDLSMLNKVDKDTKLILQTIDMYDHIIVKNDKKNNNGLLISSKNEITDNMNQKINELLLLYSKYINVNIHNLLIDIKYDNDSILKKEENILAGLLIALNAYFRNNLTPHELIYLSSKIDNLISYYIKGGFKKISFDNKNYSIGKNIYSKYFLLENLDSIEKIKEIIDKYKIIYGKDDCYFITTQDILPSNFLISLKRLYPNTIIKTVNNVQDHKILVKYN